MGTASGLFGITYQGAVNGLASQTLSIFNMVRRVITAIACPVCQRVLAPPAQDHPIDRCWCKTVFDYVCPEAVLTEAKVGEFLDAFYKSRFDGPTLSGFECHAYPASEKAWLLQHIAESGGGLDFEALLAQLQEAQAQGANHVEPTACLEYSSNSTLLNDFTKHTRRKLDPQQRFRKPLTTTQEVGWVQMEESANRPFAIKTSATTQFADAMEKHVWGRSISGEFSKYAERKLLEFGGFGIGI